VNILVCVKRVPAVAGKITLTPDAQEVDTRHLAFVMSPHEECAVEEAVRLVTAHGGSSTVLTLGPEAAIEQLRDAMAVGIERALLLETDGREWDPMDTAAAIVDAVRAERAAGIAYDLLLFGNEAADTGDYQVGIRVAHALDLPCVTGVKALEVRDRTVTARREAAGGWELFEVSLPAVMTVKEGLNLPRYPSLPGRLKAKKKGIARIPAQRTGRGPTKRRLKPPTERGSQVEILGRGPEAAPRAVDILRTLGVLSG
jgi:electron transfer flavoprotein beta subunit